METKQLKRNVYDILATEEVDHPLENRINLFISILIVLSIISVSLETVDSLASQFGGIFRGFEIFAVTVFTVEYLLRLWVCTLDPRYSSPITGRIRYACTPMALIDLLAIVPFYLPVQGYDFRFVRAVRLARVFRIFKLWNYSSSFRTLTHVLQSKKEELLVTLFAGGILVIIASSLMYYVERDAQPLVFDSIISSLWWGVSALTKVGYGDIYPITVLGKFLGSFIALLGVGVFALPAGILASGFAAEMQKKNAAPMVCPHCGKEIAAEEERNDGG